MPKGHVEATDEPVEEPLPNAAVSLGPATFTQPWAGTVFLEPGSPLCPCWGEVACVVMEQSSAQRGRDGSLAFALALSVPMGWAC